MTHPLIPSILDLAVPLARELGLEVVDATFYTNQHPPVVRIDIRNLERDTGLDDCEQMSRTLETALDNADLIRGTYILEVSSPGTSRELTTDREFIAFKGFAAIVSTREPYEGSQEWNGQLVRRDEDAVYLNRKGRLFGIPRDLVTRVTLDERRD